jgi:hypothetical protein
MKTFKFIFILFLFTAFSVNPVKAQKDKEFEVVVQSKIYLECTGDWLGGEVTYVEKVTSHSFWIEKVRDATLTGYEDADLSIPSGRTYELSQTATSTGDYSKGENLARITMDGKLVALYHFAWHTTTNANGTVTANFVKEWWDCK